MPQIIKGRGNAARNVIISLCDYSGNWPRPFADLYGFTVLHYDLKHGDDVTAPAFIESVVADVYEATFDLPEFPRVVGVLSAPPCTDFTVSGARWWPQKDADGTTEASLRVLDACVEISRFFAASDGAWWALENPVGRLPRLRPELGKPAYYFNPCEYAGWLPEGTERDRDAYTKRTGIWGTALRPLKCGVDPVMYTTKNGKRGSWMWAKLGGKSARTKELRSNTPRGFARAFAARNSKI